jgi:hypothetical protein
VKELGAEARLRRPTQNIGTAFDQSCFHFPREARARRENPRAARQLEFCLDDIRMATQHSQAELDRLFAPSLDMLCIADAHGHFQRVSPSFTDTLGRFQNQGKEAFPDEGATFFFTVAACRS